MSLAVGEIQRLLAEADRHRDARRFASAAELYERVVAVHPDRPDLWVQLGNMLKDAGRHAAADKAYGNALQRAPDVFDTHLQRARNSKLSGNREAALASLTHALKLAPSSREVVDELIHLGDSWTAARQSDLGPQLLSEVLDTVDVLRRTLARIEDELPRIASLNVLPVARYDLYRRIYKVPSAPPSDIRVGVVMPAGANLDEALALLSAMRRQRHAHGRLVVTGARHEVRRLIAGAAAESPERVASPAATVDDETTAGERLFAAAASLGDACDWLLLTDRPVVLDPEALGWIAHVAATSGAAAIVCDEDCCERKPGDTVRHSGPELRATPDPELIAQGIGLGSLLALPAHLVAELASSLHACSAEDDAPACLARLTAAAAERGTIVHLPQVLASRWLAGTAPVAALPVSHSAERAPAGEAEAAVIEVVIPTRNRHDLLDACVTALEATCNRRDRLRVTVIDNGSDELACLAMFAAGQSARRFRVLRVAEPFNWSRLNNQALAGNGEAPIVVFVNNDVEMLSPGWDDMLRTLLARTEVGVVGARLAYADRTLQHAGIVTGFNGGTEHEGRGADIDAPGPLGRWQLRRSVSAVTGAFLATRRDTFTTLAGFDAEALPIWFSDVDYCLKSWARGLRVLYEPAILALHHEAKTLTTLFGAHDRSVEYDAAAAVMRARWGERMADDPWLSPTYARLGTPTAYLRAPGAGWGV